METGDISTEICLMRYMFNVGFRHKKTPVGSGEGESPFKEWGETNRTNVEEKLRERWGGNDNTIMMKAVGFHFILSSHVGMNLENDISGQLEYEQFVCAQNELALCKRKPCSYTFILSDEPLMQMHYHTYNLDEGGSENRQICTCTNWQLHKVHLSNMHSSL